MEKTTRPSPPPPPPAAPGTPRPGVTRAGHERIPPAGRMPVPKGAGEWLIALTVRGHGAVRREAIALDAPPGELMLLEPGTAAEFAAAGGEPWEVHWILFRSRPGWIGHLRAFPLAGEGIRHVRFPEPAEGERLRTAVRHCLEDAGEDTLSRDLALNRLGEIVLLAARCLARRSMLQPLSEPIRRVLDRLRTRFEDRPSIEALARLAGLSPSHLEHRFKRETGSTILSYLIHQRLWKAANLLETTDKSVKEVACAVGFRSLSYFSRLFRRHQGMPPLEYRRNSRTRIRG